MMWIGRGFAVLMVSVCLALIPGCDSAEPDGDGGSRVSVLVANQGNFADGNGSVTRYDPDTGEVSTILSRPGSIIQSLSVRDGLVYIAMNTGDRIDVLDVSRGLVGQIVDVPSPRYLAWWGDDRLLVSNLFDNSITTIDAVNDRVTGYVDVGLNPEGILVHDGLAYVANHGFGSGSSISVVDVAAGVVTRTLQLECDGPRFAFVDRQTEMWVVCTGQTLYDLDFNAIGTTNGAVLIIDHETGEEQRRFDLDGMVTTPGPGQDAFYSEEAQALFVVLRSESIYRFDTGLNSLSSVLGPLSDAPIGAVAYDPAADLIYVGRAPGFTMAGSVSILDSEGAVVGTFAAGVAPSHIEILRESVSAP